MSIVEIHPAVKKRQYCRSFFTSPLSSLLLWHIVEKVVKGGIQWWNFQKQRLKQFSSVFLKLTTNLVHVNEKFLTLVECYISLERSWKRWLKLSPSHLQKFDKFSSLSNNWLIIHFRQAKRKDFFKPFQRVLIYSAFCDFIQKSSTCFIFIGNFK